MAFWTIRRALDAVDLLAPRVRAELLDRLAVSGAEPGQCAEVADRMAVPFHAGVISQFAGYDRLAELDWDDYRRRYGDISRLDRLLEAEGDDVNGYRVAKQADVLMLFYLLSADELGELLAGLGYDFGGAAIPRTVDYYLARTSHGSTLSAVVNSWVLARANRDRAMEFFGRVLESDIADIQGGTTAEGIHLGAMAGSIDLVQRCFTGLEIRGDRIIFEPAWLSDLGPLIVSIVYHGHRLTIRVDAEFSTSPPTPTVRAPSRSCTGAERSSSPPESRSRCRRPGARRPDEQGRCLHLATGAGASAVATTVLPAVGANHHDGAVGMLDKGIRHAAQQQAAEATSAVTADHDQLGNVAPLLQMRCGVGDTDVAAHRNFGILLLPPGQPLGENRLFVHLDIRCREQGVGVTGEGAQGEIAPRVYRHQFGVAFGGLLECRGHRGVADRAAVDTDYDRPADAGNGRRVRTGAHHDDRSLRMTDDRLQDGADPGGRAGTVGAQGDEISGGAVVQQHSRGMLGRHFRRHA